MCGLAGFVDPAVREDAEESRARAARMAERLAHRGPDGSGTWVDAEAGLALAHRRLTLGSGDRDARQPMVSASGRFVLALDGRIPNAPELARELAVEGSALRGSSDAEALLEGVEAWGIQACLARTVGPFAFALWDRRERILHLARDRMGEKPLHHGFQGRAFLFGSDLAALRAHPSWIGGIDGRALSLYMRLGYVPAPWTLHPDIHSLLPGHVLSLHLDRLDATRRVPEGVPYWSAANAVRRGLFNPFLGHESEAVEQADALMRDAVAGALPPGPAPGAWLTGDVDSAVVAALARELCGGPVRTWSIEVDDAAGPSAERAAAIARHLRSAHVALRVQEADVLPAAGRLADVQDEPLADPALLEASLVAGAAREWGPTLLTGTGGDELFLARARYGWTRTAWRAAGLVPPSLRHAAAGAALAVPERAWAGAARALGRMAPASARSADVGARVHDAASLARLEDPAEIHLALMSRWDPPSLVVPHAEEPPSALREGGEGLAWRHPVEQLAYLDLITRLPNATLVGADAVAMAQGLEIRAPLLDHRVVEFACRLPPALRMRGGKGKWVLRRVLSRYVPWHLWDGPETPPRPPVGAWLRGPLRDWAAALLDESRLRREGWLEASVVRRCWEEHLDGRRDNGGRLWTVLAFESWLERWGSGRPESEATLRRAPKPRRTVDAELPAGE